jgi:hypothetical protein
LEIDTVDAFEGREKDVIIVSLVRSNRRRDIGFLRLVQRINVALSRARRLLVIVGDASTLRGSYFDRIIRYVRANGMVIPGPRLIGRLLNARSAEREGPRLPTVGPRRRRALGRPPTPALRDWDVRAEIPPEGAASAEAAVSGSAIAERRGRRRRRRGRRPGESPSMRGDELPRRPGLTDGEDPGEPTAAFPATDSRSSFPPTDPVGSSDTPRTPALPTVPESAAQPEAAAPRPRRTRLVRPEPAEAPPESP